MYALSRESIPAASMTLDKHTSLSEQSQEIENLKLQLKESEYKLKLFKSEYFELQVELQVMRDADKYATSACVLFFLAGLAFFSATLFIP